jgi:membrane-associated protease RseP (regulator of RpoE activity)
LVRIAKFDGNFSVDLACTKKNFPPKRGKLMSKRTRMILYITLLVLGLNSLPQRASCNNSIIVDPALVAQEPNANNQSADKRPGKNQVRRIVIRVPKRLGVMIENDADPNGLKVKTVEKGSVAEKAGIQPGDTIINVAGNKITSAKELRQILGNTEYGQTGQLQVLRNGNIVSLNFTLEKSEWESQMEGRLAENFSNFEFTAPMIPEFDFQNGGPRFMFFNKGRLGVELQNLTPQLSEFFGVDRGQGMLVAEVIANSAAAQAGIKAGDVILAVNGTAIKNRSELVRELNKINVGEVTVTVMRDKRRLDLRPVLPDREKMRQEQQEEFKKRFEEHRELLKQRQGEQSNFGPAPRVKVFRKRGPGSPVEEITVDRLVEVDKIMSDARRQVEDIDIDIDDVDDIDVEDIDVDVEVDRKDLDDVKVKVKRAKADAKRSLVESQKARAKATKELRKLEKKQRQLEKDREALEQIEVEVE